MSAIVISSIMLTITVALSYSAFFTRYNILDSEYKQRSASLAEGCVDTALLKIANDSGYAGPETLTVASGSCTIRLVYASGSQTIVETQASYQNAYTDLRVGVDPANLSVNSWLEVPSF